MASGSPTEHFNNSAVAAMACSTMCPDVADEETHRLLQFSFSAMFGDVVESWPHQPAELSSDKHGPAHHLRAEPEPRF